MCFELTRKIGQIEQNFGKNKTRFLDLWHKFIFLDEIWIKRVKNGWLVVWLQ